MVTDEQTASERIIELEEMIFKFTQVLGNYTWNPDHPIQLAIDKGKALIGLGDADENVAVPSIASTTRPRILIVRMQDDGDVRYRVIGDVEVTETDDYPASDYASDSEAYNDYDEDHYTSLAREYPKNSGPYILLMDLDKDFQEKRERGSGE
jgi:hypothetical protein